VNLFSLPDPMPADEAFEVLAGGPRLRVERILSAGQASPPGFWYDQAEDEWIALLQGSAALEWEDGRALEMGPGDWILIPAGERHRVARTSSDPPCVWLVVHGPLNETARDPGPRAAGGS